MLKEINILEELQDGRAQHAPANFGGAIEYTGWHVAHAGGNVNNGDQAGFATLHANNSELKENNSSSIRFNSLYLAEKGEYMILTKTVKYRGKDKPVSELGPNSRYKVDVQCPECGEVRNVFHKSIIKAGHCICQKCSVKDVTRTFLKIGAKYNRLTVIEHSERSGWSKVRCECGTEKEVDNYQLKSGRTKSCGCLRKENKPPVFHGEDHPMWKGGVSTPRERLSSTKEYKQWRVSIFERDNYACQKCNSAENLHTHHIVPFEEDESLQMSMENGITLCKDCHTTFHNKYGRKGNNRAQLDEYLSYQKDQSLLYPIMKIVKTTTPDQIASCKVVTHPSGDQPYHLVCVTEEVVDKLDLHDDVVEDTAAFLAGYDLGGQEEK